VWAVQTVQLMLRVGITGLFIVKMSDGNDEIGSIFKIIDLCNISKGSLVGYVIAFLATRS
jgi:hypothetical protein